MLDNLTSVIESLKSRIRDHGSTLEASESQTRASLIDPLLAVLGWDTADPALVTVEYKAGVPGVKSNDKVDYALLTDGEPLILVESKSLKVRLNEGEHLSQLYRYFGATSAKVGVLTNGAEYRFYGDVVKKNAMDTKPFFVVDITNLSSGDLDTLMAFSKGNFNAENVSRISEELYYRTAIHKVLAAELKNPQKDFVEWLMSKIYEGSITPDTVVRFTKHVREALKDFFVANLAVSVEQTEVTKIDDAHETDSVHEGVVFNRTFWERKASVASLSLVDSLVEMVQEVFPGIGPKYNKHYIGLAVPGRNAQNFVIFQPRKAHLIAGFLIVQDDDFSSWLEGSNLDLLPYDKQWRRYRIRVKESDLVDKERRKTIGELIQKAYDAYPKN